jgi:hypothetical protein
MWYLIFISLTILIVYFWKVIKLIGIPWSISDTYYQLKKHGRSGLWFQIAMILSVGILLPEWLEITEGENYQCCAFLACIGLIFVGSAPCFKLELDGKVHIGATIVCGLVSLLYMIFAGYTTIPLLLAFPTGFLIYKYDKPVFWLEIWMFISTYISIIIDAIWN